MRGDLEILGLLSKKCPDFVFREARGEEQHRGKAMGRESFLYEMKRFIPLQHHV